MRRIAGPAAAEVLKIIRCLHLIVQDNSHVIAKVTWVRFEVTGFV
jgi:hypothetical protein